MGYINPNVVKEIYLPVVDDGEEGSTEDFKAKYGIDLNDIFIVVNGSITIKPIAKIYLVLLHDTYLAFLPRVAEPTFYDNGDDTYSMYVADTEGQAGYRLTLTFDTKVTHYLMNLI